MAKRRPQGASRPKPAPVKEEKKVQRRGASQQKVQTREKLDSYFAHHKSVAKDSYHRLVSTPIPTFMTVAVIAIALALPAGLYVLLKNAQTLSRDWDGNAQISLFLKSHVNEQQGRQLSRELEKEDGIARTQFISKNQALEEFISLSGFGDVMNGLEENPLPAVIVVYPKYGSLDQSEGLRQRLQKKTEVDIAQLDAEWVRKLHAILSFAERLVMALGAGLAIAVMLVMVNTIRLAIESRRDEIVIVKLVGATNSFVRRPFLYTGFWYGLGGGILAVMLVESTMMWMTNPVAELVSLYRSNFSAAGLGVGNSILVILFSSLLGLAGAWLAVGRHLKQIEPT